MKPQAARGVWGHASQKFEMQRPRNAISSIFLLQCNLHLTLVCFHLFQRCSLIALILRFCYYFFVNVSFSFRSSFGSILLFYYFCGGGSHVPALSYVIQMSAKAYACL